MTPKRTVETERRWAPWIAAIAVAPLILYIGTRFVEAAAGIELGEDAGARYRSIEANPDGLLAGAVLSGLGLLLVSVPLFFLFRAARARNERLPATMAGFCFIGPVLFCAHIITASFGQIDVARDFVQMAPDVTGDLSGAELTEAEDELIDDLIDDSSTMDIANNLLFPAVLGTMIALIYIPLQAMRVGLLTRFMGTLGMALGAVMILIPPMALLGVVMWLAGLGLVILGRGRAGLYPAWKTGEAVPWLRPGEDPQGGERQPEAPELPAGVGEEDADEELEAPAPDRNKRKRKRRR